MFNDYDELLGLQLEEYEEYSDSKSAALEDVQRLYQEYQQVVWRIPFHIAENLRGVHDCGMVFQVLLDFREVSVVSAILHDERPEFFRFLRCSVSIPLIVRTCRLFGTRSLWLQTVWS